MSATTDALDFQLKINQSNNFQFRSSEIAAFFNLAAKELFNELFFTRNRKGDILKPIPNSFQSNDFINDALQPFMRTVYPASDITGYVLHPIDLVHPTAYALPITDDCKRDATWVDIKPLTDNEAAATQFSENYRPNYKEGNNPYKWFRPFYRTTQGGIEILPNQLYPKVRLDYLIYPPDIQIANGAGSAFAWEFNRYFGNAQFVLVPADVNSLFPVNLHSEIVSRAVALAALASPDYQQNNAERTNIKITT